MTMSRVLLVKDVAFRFLAVFLAGPGSPLVGGADRQLAAWSVRRRDPAKGSVTERRSKGGLRHPGAGAAAVGGAACPRGYLGFRPATSKSQCRISLARLRACCACEKRAVGAEITPIK